MRNSVGIIYINHTNGSVRVLRSCSLSCEAISTMSSTRRQRAVMATDSEWERIGSAAQAAGMEISRFIVQRALMPDSLPPEVMRRAVREMLVLVQAGGAAPPRSRRWGSLGSRL